jgi:GT2 family glycosyltransferase
MIPHVYANIATRDGRISDEVLVATQTAVGHANRAGLRATMARSRDPYSVAACRNRAVATFTAAEQFTHLLMIDDDVSLPPDAIPRLLALSERRGAGVALGCYPTVRIPLAGTPFLYVAVMPADKSGDAGWPRAWFDGDVECAGGGTGCMLVRRDVFAALGFPWFRWLEHYDDRAAVVRATTDDMDFCARARLAGFPVWADGGVRCGHAKAVDLAMFVPPAP